MTERLMVLSHHCENPPFEPLLSSVYCIQFLCHTEKLLLNLLHFITSVHVCVCDLSHLFSCVPGVVSLVNCRVSICHPRRKEAWSVCVCCRRTPSGRGKCSCAAASLWHANRAFLSAGRVVPMHIALREIGGLHHSSGKFWDQQITVLLPPLTCRHWAAPFSLSLSLCVPLRTMCSVSLSTFLWPSQAIFYLSVRFFILALLLSQLSFYCRTVSKQRPPPVLYAGVIVTSQFSLSVILPTHTVEALILDGMLHKLLMSFACWGLWRDARTLSHIITTWRKAQEVSAMQSKPKH